MRKISSRRIEAAAQPTILRAPSANAPYATKAAFVQQAVEQAVGLTMWRFWWSVYHDAKEIRQDLASYAREFAVDKLLPNYDGEYWGRTFEAYAVGPLRKQLETYLRQWHQVVDACPETRLKLPLDRAEVDDAVFDGEVSIDAGAAPDCPELAEALRAEPEAYLLHQIEVEERSHSDLAAELYGEATKSTIAKVARRVADAVKRLQRDEDLRDLAGERFGADGLDIDYGHDHEAAAAEAIGAWVVAACGLVPAEDHDGRRETPPRAGDEDRWPLAAADLDAGREETARGSERDRAGADVPGPAEGTDPARGEAPGIEPGPCRPGPTAAPTGQSARRWHQFAPPGLTGCRSRKLLSAGERGTQPGPIPPARSVRLRGPQPWPPPVGQTRGKLLVAQCLRARPAGATGIASRWGPARAAPAPS